MKRSWKRLLSAALCAALLFGVLGVSALAADTSDGYNCYTYLGDSISWGYGLDSSVDNHDPFNVGRRVEGSFTDLVADALEARNANMTVHPAASSGARLCDFRYLLERGMGMENPYTIEDDWYGQRHPERTERLRAMGSDVVAWVSESDLVTVQLGINDLTAALVNSLYATGIIDLNKLTAISDVSSAVDYLKRGICSIGIYPEGTRSRTGELLPFHSGSFKIAQRAKAPLVIACVHGTEKARHGLFLRPRRGYLEILDCLPAERVAAMSTQKLAAYSRARIETRLKEVEGA